jgi:hypothetical protein
MPTFSAITVVDRMPTPVSHVFTPADKSPAGVAVFKRSTGVPVGDELLTMSRRESAGKVRTVTKLAVPLVQNQTVNGVVTPVVVDTNYVEITVTSSKYSSTQDRANMIGMIHKLLGVDQTNMTKYFVDLEGFYG